MKNPPKQRTGIMLCYPLEEKRLQKWIPPYIVQPKLDGERCRAIQQIEGQSLDSPILFSSTESIFRHFPHIVEAIKKQVPPDIELDGELYLHGWSFEKIHSVCSTSRLQPHPDWRRIEYHIFDLVNSNRQVDRLHELYSLNLQWPLKMVHHFPALDINKITAACKYFIDNGYEGVIVRSFDSFYERKRSTGIMKFKPTRQDSYTIVGYQEEISKEGLPKGTLGSLLCQDPEGNQFSVGSGLTAENRWQLWNQIEDLVGKTCIIQYQQLTGKGNVPRFPVFIEIV